MLAASVRVVQFRKTVPRVTDLKKLWEKEVSYMDSFSVAEVTSSVFVKSCCYM